MQNSNENSNDGRYTAPDGTVVRPEFDYVVMVLSTAKPGSTVAGLHRVYEAGLNELHFNVELKFADGGETLLCFGPETAERLADGLIAAGYGPGGARR